MNFIVILPVFIFLAMIACIVILAFKPEIFAGKKSNTVKKTTASQTDGAEYGDTKDFFPVKGFERNAMDLGNHNFRCIIEVSSTNYNLMSEQEQEIIEASYCRFLNSLSFPVQIYIQTREFDNDFMLEQLHKNIQSAQKKFPDITQYAQMYERDMRNLTGYIQNSKIKKKYIIIPFNNTELLNMSSLSEYEIRQFILDQLDNRCAIVRSQIMSIGLSAKILNQEEMAEVIYSYYHRDSFRIARDIIKGDFSTLVVDGEKQRTPNRRQNLDLILHSAISNIKQELYQSGLSGEEIQFYQYMCDVLEGFKQNDRGLTVGDLMQKAKNLAERNGYGPDFSWFYKNYPDYEFYSEKDSSNNEGITPHYPDGYEEEQNQKPSSQEPSLQEPSSQESSLQEPSSQEPSLQEPLITPQPTFYNTKTPCGFMFREVTVEEYAGFSYRR